MFKISSPKTKDCSVLPYALDAYSVAAPAAMITTIRLPSCPLALCVVSALLVSAVVTHAQTLGPAPPASIPPNASRVGLAPPAQLP